MHIETKTKISKTVNNLLAIFKIVLCLILGLIVLTLAAQLMGFENYMPFYDRLNDFFTNTSTIFYTPGKDEDENASALVYSAVALVFFILIFESITDLTAEILKVYDKSQEDALLAENQKYNERIQKKYQMHLKTAMRFIVMLKLTVHHPLLETRAFKDEKMEETIKLQSQKLLKDVYTTITMSAKCPIKTNSDILTMEIKDAEQLNNVLFLIRSICEIDKYVKSGLSYYAAVSTYDANDSTENALKDAQKLMDLRAGKKILCYQIVCECLKLVRDNHFNAVNNGEYSDCDNSIFELVNKN